MIVRKNTGGAYGALRDPSDSEGLRKDMLAVKEYLRAHCREDVDCKKAAWALGLSDSYIEKTFGREVGATIRQYVIICRVEESTKLLTGTSMRIEEICAAVGMRTPAWYTKCFHRYYGISPTEYRRRDRMGAELPDLIVKGDKNLHKVV